MFHAEMKYIVISINGIECSIIFDPFISHSEMAKNFKVVSAGFLNVYDKDGKIAVGCYGKSDTLKIKAREEVDSALIQRRLIYVP
jgi:hypothetical protein